MLSGAKPVQPLLSARIPVFRGSKLVGFVNRGEPREPARAAEWAAQDAIEISVEDGVAHLSGQVDDIHDVLALRGIAATTPGVTAIVDDLWVSCE
ncbi:MAG: BON domain-containing protein [Acetobacteraceae bacterium]